MCRLLARGAADLYRRSALPMRPDLGYTRAEKNERAWCSSNCIPSHGRIDWYGAYDVSDSQCSFWHEGGCYGENTVTLLNHRATWLAPVTAVSRTTTILIYNGVPCQREPNACMLPFWPLPSFRCPAIALISIRSKVCGHRCAKMSLTTTLCLRACTRFACKAFICMFSRDGWGNIS